MKLVIYMERKVDVMGYNENDDWMEFRGECILYMERIRENAFKKFFDKVGINYDYSYDKNKFTIYTSKPGIWIGLHGKNVEILREILSKEIKESCDVEFKEIRGKFIVAN